MIISPFPYKVIGTDEIKDGCVFNIPNFCAKRQKSMDCKLFYSKLKSSIGIQKCPFGFCAERVQFGDQDIYFTCLNIEKHSKKKDALRRIKNTDFNPRISLSKYEQLKSLFKESLTSNCNVPVEFNEAKQSALLQNEREALDNTIHEINNLTNQLISRADKLSDEVSGNFDREQIEVLSKNIYALSNLLSIRLGSYNLEVDPSIIKQTTEIDIAIFKKIEKAYKCLQDSINKNKIQVNLKGNSYNKYKSGSMLEIAFFIILENAVKYSPRGETVDVNFSEIDDSLTVTFINWGPKPSDDEIKKLNMRGYRSRNVQNQTDIQGRGIGLFLVQQICDAYNIQFQYSIEKTYKKFNGIIYAPFSIKLMFKNMIVNGSQIN